MTQFLESTILTVFNTIQVNVLLNLLNLTIILIYSVAIYFTGLQFNQFSVIGNL